MFERDISKIKTIIESKSTFVFDFDGVLADSVDIKTWAFGEIYKCHGDGVVDQVVNHHIENGGMSRFEKFKYYHKNFLNQELTEKNMQVLCDSFSSLVMKAVIDSPEIRGANKFLNNYCINNKLSFVNSATPQNEIEQIVVQRNMDKFFTFVFGSPSSKSDNLKNIFSRYNTTPEQTVFFGDAVADFKAATEVGCEFIGIGEDIEDALMYAETQPTKKYGLLENFEEVI